MSALTLDELIDILVAARRAGGFRYEHQARVLAQFAEHCSLEGYADGLDHPGSRRGLPLRPPPQGIDDPPRGDHPARTGRARPPVRLAGMGAADADAPQDPAPAAAIRVQRRGDPSSVPSDRYPAALRDVQPGSGSTRCCSRARYSTGMRISEALGLELRDFDPARATVEVRDGKNRESRTLPVTARLAATLGTYITAAHPCPEPSHKLFHTGDPSRPADQSTVYNRFRRYLADAGIPISPEARTSTRCATVSPSRTCAAGRSPARTSWSCCPTCPPTWATPTCAEPSTTSS